MCTTWPAFWTMRLAWDNAFFTSAGFLEPEELSTMIQGVEQSQKRIALPGIEEEICRSSESICTSSIDKSMSGTLENDMFGDTSASVQKSSKACQDTEKAGKSELKRASTGIEEHMLRSNDSVSTLATDSSTLGALGDEFFRDTRASIQKSSKASRSISQAKVSGVKASQVIKSSEKVGTVLQNKLMTKSALKKPSVVTKGPGKMANKGSISAEASKYGARTKDSDSSRSKPPKITARPNSISAAPTKRASITSNSSKVEKDSAKNSTVPGRRTKFIANGASQYGVPKPLALVKSSLRSSVSSKTPSSSIDSFESLSSSISKHSSGIEICKIDSKTNICSPSTSTARTGSRTALTALRNIPMSSRIPPHLKSVSNPSSSITPASSISEWSSHSMSPTSTLNNRSSISRPSIDSSSWKNTSKKFGSSPENHSNDNFSAGNSSWVSGLLNKSAKIVSAGSGSLNHLEAIKPSGLRMPSPKIGFFDGAKSMVRTPSRSLKSPAAPWNLPGSELGNASPGRGFVEARHEKFQPARSVMAIRGTKPKSPLPLQEATNVSQKVSSGSNVGKNNPGVPLKVQNKKFPEKNEQYGLQVQNIACKESNALISNPDLCYSERSSSPCKDKSSSQVKDKNSSRSGKHSPAVSLKFQNKKSPGKDAQCYLNLENIAVEEFNIASSSPESRETQRSSGCKGKLSIIGAGNNSEKVQDSPTGSETKMESPLPLQKDSRLSPKVISGSKTGKHSPIMPHEIQNKKSPGKDEEHKWNTENVASKESNVVMCNPDFCSPERSHSEYKGKLSLDSEGNNSGKIEDIPSVAGSSAACSSSSVSAKKGELCGQKRDLDSFSDSSKKGKYHVDDEVDGLTRQLEALKIVGQIQQKPADRSSFHEANASAEVQPGGIKT